MKITSGILALFFSVFLVSAIYADRNSETLGKSDMTIVYFFWGDGCPHCMREKPFLEQLKRRFPGIEVRAYEVWHNRENAELFNRMSKSYGVETSGVPTTFVNNRAFVGFSGEISVAIEREVTHCVKYGCIDPISKSGGRSENRVQKQGDTIITLPIFGKIDTSKVSLPFFTIMLASLDSFNPCAFFVLFFLLSLLIHARSRKRMVLIGGTFVFFSGFVYFIFMAAWLNIFLLIGQVKVVTVIAGTIALIIAAINIKDFFFFRQGVSLSISENAKPKLFERMRNLLKADSISSLMTGAIVLAVTANAYELLCTAGFPMVFTRVLTLNNLTAAQHYLYLALYNLIYVIPLAIIVLIFTVTLGSRKLSGWQGRKLKLISGMMMLGLAIVLIVNPALLNNVLAAGGLLLLSLGVSGIIIFFTRKSNSEREIT